MSDLIDALRARVRGVRGQTTSEYVVLTAMATAIASAMVALLGLSIRKAFFNVAQRILGVITGGP